MNKHLSSGAITVSLTSAAVVIWSAEILAHVKWFVGPIADQSVAVPPFSWVEPAVQIWAIIIIAALAMALLVDAYVPPAPAALTNFFRRHRQDCAELFQLLVGLGLLLTAVKGAIFAPHLADAHPVGLLLRFAEGTAGVLLIANKAVRAAAGLLVVVFFASTALFGFVSSLEYFNFLGIAVFLLLSPGRCSVYAVPLLRVHTGIALAAVA